MRSNQSNEVGIRNNGILLSFVRVYDEVHLHTAFSIDGHLHTALNETFEKMEQERETY